jgi:hypothetical protein
MRVINKAKNKVALILFIFSVSILTAQTEERSVSVISSGQGKTKEEATQIALRLAIEQSFGMFISSKTEILNDLIVADQITSLSAGNIQSYETLNEAQLPNDIWALTLKAVVSVEKLATFVQSKGYEVDVKGGLFSINIKQQLLNEQAEIDAICEMIGVLHEPMQTAFDFKINTGEPISLDNESLNWEIPIDVYSVANANLEICMNYLIRTINSVALTSTEVENYQKLNKKTYKVVLFSGKDEIVYHFRKSKTIRALLGFINNWEFYVNLFELSDGINTFKFKDLNVDNYIFQDNYYNHQYTSNKYIYRTESSVIYDLGDYESKMSWKHYHNWDYYKGDGFNNYSFLDYSGGLKLYIFHPNDTVAKISWKDSRNLAELERLEKFVIKSRGIISEFKHGGYVIYQDSGHGLVASLLDVEMKYTDVSSIIPRKTTVNLDNMDSLCSTHKINGYNDWVVPSLNEMKMIYDFLGENNISIFNISGYHQYKDYGFKNEPCSYMTNTDTGMIFLNNYFQIRKEEYTALLLNPAYRLPDERISTNNIYRGGLCGNVALMMRLNASSSGLVRPVRKF